MIASQLEKTAVNKVLEKLGPDMFRVIKYHLNHYYHVDLDESGQLECNVEELSNALQKLIGKGAAELLVQDIFIELDALASQQ